MGAKNACVLSDLQVDFHRVSTSVWRVGFDFLESPRSPTPPLPPRKRVGWTAQKVQGPPPPPGGSVGLFEKSKVQGGWGPNTRGGVYKVTCIILYSLGFFLTVEGRA